MEETIRVLVMVGGLVGIGVGALWAVAGAVAQFRHGQPSSPRDTASVDDRLSRLEQAVEAIAVEVERVGEGQRFVTRLMAETRALPNADHPAATNP